MFSDEFLENPNMQNRASIVFICTWVKSRYHVDTAWVKSLILCICTCLRFNRVYHPLGYSCSWWKTVHFSLSSINRFLAVFFTSLRVSVVPNKASRRTLLFFCLRYRWSRKMIRCSRYLRITVAILFAVLVTLAQYNFLGSIGRLRFQGHISSTISTGAVEDTVRTTEEGNGHFW